MSNANLKYLQSLEKFGINLGLERITGLLEQLGNPHLKFRSIHIAGTNGKGSTCAMIASILKEAGFKVGLYTSPHLFKFNERIKIDGKDIPRKEFLQGLARIRRISREKQGNPEPRIHSRVPIGQPTVFEVLTAGAFLYFAKKKVDYAVVEVGLGGRLDATNVITPLVSVITNIDYEHTAVLGKTLAKIAAEKGGIIKPGVPVVTAEGKTEPVRTLKAICEKKKCLLVQIRKPKADSRQPNTGVLIGKHQQINAACAIAAIKAAGIGVSQNVIKAGLRQVKWPARFQIVAKKPLTIVDGAHNPAGARVLINTLKSQFPGRKFTFIFGVNRDKDSKTMLRLFGPLVDKTIITCSASKTAAQLVAGQKPISLAKALRISAGSDRVIAGSLYLAADAMKRLTAIKTHSKINS